jgi:O-methyltransferase
MLHNLNNSVFKDRTQNLQLKLLSLVARILLPKYRFKWPNVDWWSNEFFNEYLSKFGELRGFNSDRRWMLHQLIRLTENIPGDTVECGVYQGAGSYLICMANLHSKGHIRSHHMFDSFEGLSKPTIFDGFHWSKGDLSCSLDIVIENLRNFPNIYFFKGWIPERFRDIEDRLFSFVHIDVDLYEPTKDSLEFFYPRLNTGGIILCDDYGFDTCPGATYAIDEFLLNKEEQMISLPDGGGFLIKGVKTAQEIFTHR